MTAIRVLIASVMAIGAVEVGSVQPLEPIAGQDPSVPPYARIGSLRTPTMFGEGIISTSDDEYGGTFSPDGKTVYFNKSVPFSYRYTICVSRWIDGYWSTPEVAPFSGRWSDSDPAISADGSTLLWTSDRPVDGKVKHDYDIWMVKRTPNGGWGEPIHLPAPINSDASEFFASMARNGTLYFSSAREAGIQVYRSHFERGAWSSPENLSRQINGPDTTAYYDLDVEVDPDERFVILSSVGRPDGFGHFDLYISWSRENGWTRPLHLPPPFNTPARDYSPHITPDGKYLMFSSERGFALEPIARPLNYAELVGKLRSTLNGGGNIYQIDLTALTALAPSAQPGSH